MHTLLLPAQRFTTHVVMTVVYAADLIVVAIEHRRSAVLHGRARTETAKSIECLRRCTLPPHGATT
jgi:hypothetical protein